ncbi:MAG: hypothetical protein II075_09500 [Bacteroidales bacterium]|nr:hypothetical protein [Bacteroidales bacterium]
MNNFFQKNTFIIDQKVWTIANSYRILGEDGQQIGVIQENLPASRFILSLFMSKKNLPFTLHLKDADGNIMATIEKGFSLFTATIAIIDSNGARIGTIKQKFTLLKPSYEVYDASNNLIGTISGDWLAWDFKILDNGQNILATISKKWNGAMKELFTDSDKYIISVSPQVTNERIRMAIISASAVIDKINKEIN